MGHQAISEASPLLPKSAGSDADIAPNGTSPNPTTTHVSGDQSLESTDDRESQKFGDERLAQYDGMPEVKARLKYILPAIGIGVWLLLIRIAL